MSQQGRRACLWRDTVEIAHTAPYYFFGKDETFALGRVQAKYDVRNPNALKQLVGHKTKVAPFSKDIMDLAFKQSMALYPELSAKDPSCKKVYTDYAGFRAFPK